MQTKKLGNYTLDILDVTEFKNYYYEHKKNFSTLSMNSFLKALDIPPKFFKEQPEETQDELLDNRDTFVRESKKFFGKVIIVLKVDENILNACRMAYKDAEVAYAKLQTIDNIHNKFEHRSFIKDGYISYVVGNEIKKGVENQVLAIDFPVLLNKKPVIHRAIYQLPDETFATPIEHVHYLTSDEIDLDIDYLNIESAINDYLPFLTEARAEVSNEKILRETELVSLALVEAGTIPRGHQEKVSSYISRNTKGVLTTLSLESLILDFDEEMKSYKQVTSLREVSGSQVLAVLKSDNFKALLEEMEATEDEKPELISI